MNCNICLILKLLFLIVIFVVLIIINRNKDTFVSFANQRIEGERETSLGYFSVVDTDLESSESYDLEKLGPTCVAKCIAEHGPNIQFNNPDGNNDALKWNKDNPNKGYCYRANSKRYPFECDEDCQKNKCTINLNNPIESGGDYDPDKDFSQCMVDSEGNCVEKKLNALSGISCLTTVGCKLCIEKYWDNLSNINNIFLDEIEDSSRCPNPTRN